ncbi:dUTP diphosphatase [Bacillus safensis]|uniref:dUTP diphosphatase n=1 Tax=Bacillus safensis TaxID=561879 RepID=UPI000E71A55E|nr:dUTP diphosphatase [Bacillus safensis]RKE76753.1 dimeric dUTPase (all-alpha-NTP-PPase superfamily) [Bacillus safensis]
MNLQKMFEMQKELDDRIIREKGLEGQDLLPNTYVALITELGEFANEGRWFKHWSDKKEPKRKVFTTAGATPENATHFRCESDDCGEFPTIEDFKNLFEPNYDECPICEAGSVTIYREVDPLLEEYADCIHFFLSIAIRKGWKEELHIPEEAIEEFKEEGLDGGLSGAFLEMQWSLLNSRMFKEKKKEHFRVAWGMFLAIGIVGFGFTLDQIEKAYMDKNAVNHKRQQEGY